MSENKNTEIRTRDTVYTVDDGVRLSGRAVCFNEVSEVLYDPKNHRYFREVIAPGAITQDLVDGSDIKLLVDHDRNRMLARRRNGGGSLSVEVREDGVWSGCDRPDTTLGHDMWELVRRGDYSQMSFAFTVEPADVTWDRSGDVPTRTVNRISGLYDLSIVQDPAYTQTSVDARSIDELAEKADEDKTLPEQPAPDTRDNADEPADGEKEFRLDALREEIDNL